MTVGDPVPEGFVEVRVTIDGEPSPETVVVQGGTPGKWLTDERGVALVPVNADVEGELLLMASHPRARIKNAPFEPGVTERVTISLTRYDASDNPDFEFFDPGTPTRRPNTNQCGHCHQTINEAWVVSPHRSAASNPIVHDLYSGTASVDSAEACEAAGGRWLLGRLPGGGEGERCYLGHGALPALNPDACGDGPCKRTPTRVGGCADCHAPEINKTLGGNDLLDAEGLSYDFGVSCSVCHLTESVVLDAEPGVAGRLKLMRPSEPAPLSIGGGGFLPLIFGPSHDSPNPRMGSVQRDHFRDGSLCAGCHQHESEVLVQGVEIDAARWPDGRLPVQTTYEEWRTGALGEATRCPSCHMPPDAQVANGADLQRFELAEVGVQGGWHRPPGQVRRHSWIGPRQPESRMLQLAAALKVRKTLQGDGRLTVEVETRNIGAGHAIPTGEPMRHMLLVVEAWCSEAPLRAVGGDAVPDFGGWLDRRDASADWSRWPGARVGDRVRVVRRPGAFYDYDGFDRFARDGGLTPQERGMPVEEVVGAARVVAVDGDLVSFDVELPQGDVAYRVRPRSEATDAEERAALTGLAGAAGFGFARVMVGVEGERMVPHFLATDVVSDNRLMPQRSWTTTHHFAAQCDEPQVQATLLYRPYAWELARQKRWPQSEAVMEEVRR